MGQFMIPRMRVRLLIRLGRQVDSDFAEALQPLARRGRGRWGSDDWREVAANLSDEDLILLIKGFTTAERELSWSGGSASNVIVLFRALQERSPEQAAPTASWVLQNTNNSYLPYGSDNYGARTAEEWGRAWWGRRAGIAEGLQRDRKSDEDARAERQERARQRERSAADRDSEVRKQLLQELADLPVVEQIQRAAYDPIYSIEFYPTRLADSISGEIIKAMDSETHRALAKKLKGRRRGPWAKLKRHLGGSSLWNREPWNL